MSVLDVLIPHYEDASGLALSLDSVYAQNNSDNFRVVICDDGSSVSTREALEEIAQQHSNIVLINNEKNQGRARTRNTLLDSIESPYTAWLDAGDEWYPEKIKLQFDAIYRSMFRQRENVVWATCNYDWQWNLGRKRKRKQNINGDQMKSLMVGQSLRSYLWTVLAESENFKNVGYFDEKLPRLQDLDYFMRFVSRGGRLISPDTDKPLCVYHKSDVGRNAEEIKSCYYHIYNKHAHAYGKFRPVFRRNRRYDIELHAARFAQNNNNRTAMCKSIARAAAINPTRFFYSLLKNKGLKL